MAGRMTAATRPAWQRADGQSTGAGGARTPRPCYAGAMQHKQADAHHPIHDVIARRWSPYVFADRPVDPADLRSIFEAARWAASSYNEQPWRWIVATADEAAEHARLLSCFVEPNQPWARRAPVLGLGVASLRFERNGRDNPAALHDLGLAAGNLSHEVTARGLHVHWMIGILPERARELYAVPGGVLCSDRCQTSTRTPTTRSTI